VHVLLLAAALEAVQVAAAVAAAGLKAAVGNECQQPG
jgi:hypothetical protein